MPADVWAAYAKTIIEIGWSRERVLEMWPDAVARGPWPGGERPVYVITAANPGSRRLREEENLRRNTALRCELEASGVNWRWAIGYAPDGSWIECSYAMLGVDIGAALELAKRFEQAAIFSCTGSSIQVVSSCGSVFPSNPRTSRWLRWRTSRLGRSLDVERPSQ